MVDRTRRVEVECPDGRSGWGSGVILGPAHHALGYVVLATAAHVTKPGCDATVRGRPVVELARDEEADVSLVLMEGDGYWPLELSRGWLGMPVVAVGWPVQPKTGKAGLQVSRGWYTADLGDRLKVSAPTYFGNSGGPIFDEDGRLVGLLVSGLISWNYSVEGEHYVTPAQRVLEMYEALR
jgi:S1-C subfamily serine protease